MRFTCESADRRGTANLSAGSATRLPEDGVDYGLFKEQQYDKLAATLRKYLDLDAIYKMMREYE